MRVGVAGAAWTSSPFWPIPFQGPSSGLATKTACGTAGAGALPGAVRELPMPLEVTVLVDNDARDERLRAEHGLSLLIRRANGQTLLLDAGATGNTLLGNAEQLGIDLAAVPMAVLSHGHYDHAGGLPALALRTPKLDLYCSPSAFTRRYAARPGRPLRSIAGPSARQLRHLGLRIVEVGGPMRLDDDLILSGPIGGPTWDAEHFFVHRDEELVEDAFCDEIFVMARAQAGWVVFSGCCHRGLPNTLRLAKFLAHGEPIAAIVGGLHLRSAAPDRLGELVPLLEQTGQPAIHANHCTGEGALKYLARHYGGAVRQFGAGSVLSF